jgi:hypothetical protein
MATKLTLTLDENTLRIAKLYAKKKGLSLSAIIESFLKALSKEGSENSYKEEVPPSVKKLRGSIPLPRDADYKTVLTDALIKKYKE